MKTIHRLPFCNVILAAAFLTASCGKKASNSAAVPPPPAMEPAMRGWLPIDKFLRQTFAREHFLSAVPVWRDDHARKIADLGHRYNVLHDQWADGLLPPPTLSAEESEKKAAEMMEIQNQLTEAFNQSGQLTPEGAKALEAWEARHWNGYLLPQDFFHDALPPQKLPVASTPQEKAAVAFRTKRAAQAQPLIEALKKVSPPPGGEEIAGPLSGNPAPPLLSPPFDGEKTAPHPKSLTSVASALGLPELTAKNRDAMKALRNQCEESARLYADWSFKNWEGYADGDAP